MTAFLQISIINLSAINYSHEYFCKKPINIYPLSRRKIISWQQNRAKLRAYTCSQKWTFSGVGRVKDGIWIKEERPKGQKREVLVRFNEGFGFNGGGGGGGGGGRGDGSTARIIGNLVLAIGLTYLSMTGQLGWVLDAIASIWLFAVVAPIVGLGVFLWWAGRDIIQGTRLSHASSINPPNVFSPSIPMSVQCPNCGNDFQVFKSTLNEELQLCPFCSQPFSVLDDKFVRDSVTFSSQSTTFGQAFKDFSSSFKKGKDSSAAVVDVEAEIKDAD